MTPARVSDSKPGSSRAVGKVVAKKVAPKAQATKVAPARVSASAKTSTAATKGSKSTKAVGASKTTKATSAPKSAVSAKSPSRSGTKTGESVPKRPVKAGNDQAGASKPGTSNAVAKAPKVTKATATKSSSKTSTTKVAPAKALAAKDATSKAADQPAAKKPLAKASASAKAPAKQAAKEAAAAPKAAAAKTTKAATKPAEPVPETQKPVAEAPVADTAIAEKASRHAKSTAKAPPTTPKGGPGPYATEPKFLEEQHKMLLEERETYQGQMTDLRAEAESLALEREPGDVQFDEESGEGGTVAVDRERDLTLAAQAQNTIAQIDLAIMSIADKTYGVCENCRQAVPKARLRALPYVRLCMACKSGGLHRR